MRRDGLNVSCFVVCRHNPGIMRLLQAHDGCAPLSCVPEGSVVPLVHGRAGRDCLRAPSVAPQHLNPTLKVPNPSNYFPHSRHTGPIPLPSHRRRRWRWTKAPTSMGWAQSPEMLLWAAFQGDMTMGLLLLDRGADPN